MRRTIINVNNWIDLDTVLDGRTSVKDLEENRTRCLLNDPFRPFNHLLLSPLTILYVGYQTKGNSDNPQTPVAHLSISDCNRLQTYVKFAVCAAKSRVCSVNTGMDPIVPTFDRFISRTSYLVNEWGNRLQKRRNQVEPWITGLVPMIPTFE